MAIFRKVNTSFWSDSFISDLDAQSKLFYLYLITNERTRQCGVYEITKKQISYDLGYSIDTVSILLDKFISYGKIKYNEVTKEVAIGNWLKYNNSSSPKVKSCIDKEFQYCKDTVLIEYVKSIGTLSQEEEEEEEEEEVSTPESEKVKKLTEMFKRVRVWQEWELKIEVGKFLNKYPKIEPHKAASLINKWASNYIPLPIPKSERHWSTHI